jgi:predicted ABC-type ATPase
MTTNPQVIVLAGPNGAGKSTAAANLLPEGMTFVNADEIAKTQPNYPSREADIQAGRRVLARLDELEQGRLDFAIETTLSGRSLATRIARLRAHDYFFRLLFLWTPNAEFSLLRVAARVQAGGHDIPEETIRRRHASGLRNFMGLYRRFADRWEVYDSTRLVPSLIAEGTMETVLRIDDPGVWERMQEIANG